MPTTVVDPYTTAADVIKSVVDAEFTDLGVQSIHDKLHESLGSDYIAVGISPLYDAPLPQNATAGSLSIEIRFYNFWDKEIDPEQSVDPRIITTIAERLKRALQAVQATRSGSPEVWYFRWNRTDYPDDPTGNKTRFHMRIEALGDNTTLIETR